MGPEDGASRPPAPAPAPPFSAGGGGNSGGNGSGSGSGSGSNLNVNLTLSLSPGTDPGALASALTAMLQQLQQPQQQQQEQQQPCSLPPKQQQQKKKKLLGDGDDDDGGGDEQQHQKKRPPSGGGASLSSPSHYNPNAHLSSLQAPSRPPTARQGSSSSSSSSSRFYWNKRKWNGDGSPASASPHELFVAALAFARRHRIHERFGPTKILARMIEDNEGRGSRGADLEGLTRKKVEDYCAKYRMKERTAGASASASALSASALSSSAASAAAATSASAAPPPPPPSSSSTASANAAASSFAVSRGVSGDDRSRFSSRYRGVHYARLFRKWAATVCMPSSVRRGVPSCPRHWCVGYYGSEREAARAYDVAAIQTRGPEAASEVLNGTLLDYLTPAGEWRAPPPAPSTEKGAAALAAAAKVRSEAALAAMEEDEGEGEGDDG